MRLSIFEKINDKKISKICRSFQMPSVHKMANHTLEAFQKML